MLFSYSIIMFFLTIIARAQTTPPPIIGRWDMTVSIGNAKHPAWLEVEQSGYQALVGRFVGRIGGARPIGKIEWKDGVARFSIPPEWEGPSSTDLIFEARVQDNGSLIGTITMPTGRVAQFVGKRAPSLRREMPKAWGSPVPLFNGKDLSGWTPAPTARNLPSHWIVRDGLLVNTADEGSNLMTVEKFQDFKLHAEFRLPDGGTSGIFPRGRYWIVLKQKPDSEPVNDTMGAVYKFLLPNENAALGPGVWQTMDLTLVGRRLTVVVNGKSVIVDQIIPGITGSAIDSDEASSGPIMLQGEELRCQVEFRKITIRVPR
jgi:hypothetical protein